MSKTNLCVCPSMSTRAIVEKTQIARIQVAYFLINRDIIVRNLKYQTQRYENYNDLFKGLDQ